MSQITHFCGVKFLAWKSGSVKFWTNILSGKTDIQKAYILAPATFLPRKTPWKKNPMLSVTTPKIFAKHIKLATRSKNCHWPVCLFCVSDTNYNHLRISAAPAWIPSASSHWHSFEFEGPHFDINVTNPVLVMILSKDIFAFTFL